MGLRRPLGFRRLVRSVLSGPGCGGDSVGQAGGLVAAPRLGALWRPGLSRQLAGGGCDSALWMWLAWSVLWLAWVDRLASHGVGVLVW